MDSALLNIWRENGAFLRYGDAKALFLMSVSIAALFSFLRHTLIAPGSDWAQISYIFDADMGLHSWLTVLSFSFSALVSLLVIAPTLSDRMIRVTFFNTLGQCLQRGPIQRAELGFLTFRDIAKHSDADEYVDRLRELDVLNRDADEKNENLARQVWVISRIAYAKFSAVNLSLLSLAIGFFFSLCAA
ncbi:Pycsar system effector family protein [Pseudophaeobacter sp. C1-32P7]|uniref:Pycsar system effector family protein n=1 Tax=Pseudophaeobacter sp. C1-32P7 TaxID=3098142 RepID=UPI0034D6EFD3